MIQITARGNNAQCTIAENLTSGMVGLQCKFEFDDAWDGLSRTAVFLAGNERKDVLLTGDTCTVPWEVLKTAGYQLIKETCEEVFPEAIVICTPLLRTSNAFGRVSTMLFVLTVRSAGPMSQLASSNAKVKGPP